MRFSSDKMLVQVKEAPVEQKPIIERLMQLYLYDFSGFESGDVSQEGLYEYRYLDSYWTEIDRFPFLIFVNHKIAGFILVNSHTCIYQKGEAKSIAEFFVMRKYRRRRIGKRVAFYIFRKFPGKWEVQQTMRNKTAQLFWRSVIGEYTGGNFTETVMDSENWHGPIQSFDKGDMT